MIDCLSNDEEGDGGGVPIQSGALGFKVHYVDYNLFIFAKHIWGDKFILTFFFFLNFFAFFSGDKYIFPIHSSSSFNFS
jgi:hypothetical protein